METALGIVIDDAGPFDAMRRDYAAETFALGIPFHVTLLYPFAPREELSEDLLADARSFFAGRPPFDFQLTRVAGHLPRRCQARDAALLEEYGPDRWRERDRFPLGG